MSKRFDGVRITYTGVIPLIYKAQRELLNDLVESFLLAFGGHRIGDDRGAP